MKLIYEDKSSNIWTEKASKATVNGLEVEYAEAKVAYEKNHNSTTKK